MELIQLLRATVDRGASDVHLKAGRPPIVRFDGELEPATGLLAARHARAGGTS